MIIVDFYLAVYTVLLDKDNIMPDLKSKWDDLDIMFWELVEMFCFALTYTLNHKDNYWSYGFFELYTFSLELHRESCELQYPQILS